MSVGTGKRSREWLFRSYKKLLPILQFFSTLILKKELILNADSNSVALGAVLLQEIQPVAFASKLLTATQNRSVENTGAAFVKGADERNKFFQKINNQ